MTNATFHNIDTKPFTGYWDGKPKTFKAGERVHMPSWLAEHFAKHLTNRLLQEAGKEVYCSPKFPAQVPQFMEIFGKCFIADAPRPADAKEGDIDDLIAAAETPSMDIVVKKPEVIDQGPAAALAAQSAPDEESQIINPPEEAAEEVVAVGLE